MLCDYKTNPTRKALCAAPLVTQAVEWVRAGGRGSRRKGGPGKRSGGGGLFREACGEFRHPGPSAPLSPVGSSRGESRRPGASLKLGMMERPGAVRQRREGEQALGRGSLGAASAERACPWAKVPPRAAEACDFANPGPGRCRSPTPGGATPQPEVAARAGARAGDRGLGPPLPPNF